MNYYIILGVVLFVIVISIQYTLNKILVELKDIKRFIVKSKINNSDKNI